MSASRPGGKVCFRPIADLRGLDRLRPLPTAGRIMLRFGSLALLAILAAGGCAHRPEVAGRASLIVQAENTRMRCTFVDTDDYAENASRCFYAYFLVSDTLQQLADEARHGRRLARRQMGNVVSSANLIRPYEYLQSPEAAERVRSSLAVIVGSHPLAASLDPAYQAPRPEN